MHELEKAKFDKIMAMTKDKDAVWKDPKGHSHAFSISGKYESISLFCDKCKTAYILEKEEVEKL